MEDSRVYYGGTFFDREELNGTDINSRVELEYYRTKNKHNERATYGIEVIKKEYKEKEISVEKNNINNISNNTNRIEEIINTLKKHKVTPICLNDVMEDILYQKITE